MFLKPVVLGLLVVGVVVVVVYVAGWERYARQLKTALPPLSCSDTHAETETVAAEGEASWPGLPAGTGEDDVADIIWMKLIEEAQGNALDKAKEELCSRVESKVNKPDYSDKCGDSCLRQGSASCDNPEVKGVDWEDGGFQRQVEEGVASVAVTGEVFGGCDCNYECVPEPPSDDYVVVNCPESDYGYNAGTNTTDLLVGTGSNDKPLRDPREAYRIAREKAEKRACRLAGFSDDCKASEVVEHAERKAAEKIWCESPCMPPEDGDMPAFRCNSSYRSRPATASASCSYEKDESGNPRHTCVVAKHVVSDCKLTCAAPTPPPNPVLKAYPAWQNRYPMSWASGLYATVTGSTASDVVIIDCWLPAPKVELGTVGPQAGRRCETNVPSGQAVILRGSVGEDLPPYRGYDQEWSCWRVAGQEKELIVAGQKEESIKFIMSADTTCKFNITPWGSPLPSATPTPSG